MVDLDPRWNWLEAVGFDGRTRYHRTTCNHLELEPVTAATGERVATLCRTCDSQLPAEVTL